jgi:hypothetical protein
MIVPIDGIAVRAVWEIGRISGGYCIICFTATAAITGGNIPGRTPVRCEVGACRAVHRTRGDWPARRYIDPKRDGFAGTDRR